MHNSLQCKPTTAPDPWVRRKAVQQGKRLDQANGAVLLATQTTHPSVILCGENFLPRVRSKSFLLYFSEYSFKKRCISYVCKCLDVLLMPQKPQSSTGFLANRVTGGCELVEIEPFLSAKAASISTAPSLNQ